MIIMSMFNIAITIRSFNTEGPAMKKLRDHFSISYINTTGKRLTEEQIVAAIHDADAVIAGTESYSAVVISKSPRLAIISRVGVGLDSIDMIAAEKRKISVLSTPDSPVPAVAEHALALMLSILKKIPSYNHEIRSGNPPVSPGGMLSGKTIGIIGMGRIGRRMAGILDNLGCRILFYDPYISEPALGHFKKRNSLNDLLADADIISLHAPPSTDGRPLLDRPALSCCKRGIIIINTARGTLIDEPALADALKNGTVAAAGLDVFGHEPYDGPLLSFPQVIATPHVASNTAESRDMMEMESVNNLIGRITRLNA